MNRKLSFWKKLKAYKLDSNMYVLVLLVVSVIASVIVYLVPAVQQLSFASDLALACATSLLASIFCLISDIYVKFRTYENDVFLESIEEFGINNLHFDKTSLLEYLLEDCRYELWVSGYRLILTASLSKLIGDAVARGIRVRILISPPWNQSFRSIYGTDSKVMDNYCRVFAALMQSPDVNTLCQVRFTSKPLFNDTYKVDDHLVTGPYLHNRDKDFKRISAKDFFTFDLVRRSPLYQLVSEEYDTLWSESEEALDWEQFAPVLAQIRSGDYRESEKIKLVHSACRSLLPPGAGAQLPEAAEAATPSLPAGTAAEG